MMMLKMAGLDLSAERSGKTSDTVNPVISKKGKADLRYALYQAALIASTRNRQWMTYRFAGVEERNGNQDQKKDQVVSFFLYIFS